MKKKHSSLRIILALSGAAAALLAIIYASVSVYFSKHFYFRTKLNGSDVSCYTSDDVKENWESIISSYELRIAEKDGTVDVLKGSDIGLALQWNDSVDALIQAQKGYDWIVKFFHPDTLSCEKVVDYSKDALSTAVRELPCMSSEKQVMPINATYSTFSPEEGFTLIPSVEGTAINLDYLEEGVAQKILDLSGSYDINTEGAYYQPSIADDNENLLSAIEQLNKLCKTVITYEVGDDTFTLGPDTYGKWLTVDDEYNVWINDDDALAYAAELASKYNTYNKAKTLRTSYGTTVTIRNVHYGWKVDQSAEAKQIMQEIRAGEDVTRDPNYSMTARSHGSQDYGSSYVEISIANQKLFLYKGGRRVLESDIVSGNESKGWGTPGGAFGITYKTKDATLRGEDYETPVSYWMPFNGGIGLHDAYWRSSFGGTLYKTSGSHGCINLPPSVAETVYSYVSTGFPVLVY